MAYLNSVIDRALPENDGSGLFSKKSNGKYSLFLPVTNLGEIGSSPEQIEKTVIGNLAKSYVKGRKDSPQQTLTFYIHRDNLAILEAVKGTVVEFLRVFPDFSGVKYSGEVDYKINDTALNSAEQGELSITITVPETIVDDCYALLEDTALFTSDIPEVIELTGTESQVINITTDPSDATISAVSGTTGTATASVADKALTITGVATGTSIVRITVSKTNYASWVRSVFVIVK